MILMASCEIITQGILIEHFSTEKLNQEPFSYWVEGPKIYWKSHDEFSPFDHIKSMDQNCSDETLLAVDFRSYSINVLEIYYLTHILNKQIKWKQNNIRTS